VSNYAPAIFKTFLEQIQTYVSGQAWLSQKVQYHILAFFTEWSAHDTFHPRSSQ
jgi:hypothetical protein